MADIADGLDHTATDSREEVYLLLVQFFIYQRKMTIEAAHREVDAIYKWMEING